MGITPDFVIVRHAYIYSLTRFGYVPHTFWNLRIRYLLWVNESRVRRAISEWHRMIRGAFLGVKTVRRSGSELCFRFDSEESVEVAAGLLREKARPYRQLQIFKYVREVDVRSVPFTKGLAVSELARHLGIRRDHILAVGDGHNDISMLNGDVAKLTGCPVNADPEVMEVVHKSGGHIAKGRSLTGVLEIMNAYATDTVCSDLPDDWQEPSERYNPNARRSIRKPMNRRSLTSVFVFVGSVYAALLVFASFDLIPFSKALMKPYGLLEELIEKLFNLLGGLV
jgi:hypothetical protein